MKALIVEDDGDIRDLISSQVSLLGHEVVCASSGEEGLSLVKNDEEINFFILDWMLPGVTGIEICRFLRTQSKTKDQPILMITALTKPEHIVEGLDAGADDYITKPFDLGELNARVKALARRVERITKRGRDEDNISIGPLEINASKVKLTRQGREVLLTQSEFVILHELMKKPGHVLTRKQLYNSIQGPNTFASERTIDTHMAGLRKKLDESGDMIETIRGIGYRFKEEA